MTNAGQHRSRNLGLSGREAIAALVVTAFFGFMCATAPSAQAQTFTTFDALGAGTSMNQGTEPSAINDAGDTAGYYIDAANVFHGFVRTAKGAITTFDVTGAGTGVNQGTEPSGINDAGVIAGYYLDAGNVFHGFVRTASGAITSFDIPAAGTGAGQGTVGIAIDASGTIAGNFIDAKHVKTGFVRTNNGTVTTFAAPDAGSVTIIATIPLSIDDAGDIAGYYVDSNNVDHGFVRDSNGTLTEFDVPTAGTGADQGTIGSSINASGEIVGSYIDADNISHGFLRAADATLTTIDIPGAGVAAQQGTRALGINAAGDTTGYFVDMNTAGHGFAQTDTGAITTFEAPGAGLGASQGTFSAAIDTLGNITGYYIDATTVSHGFVLTPWASLKSPTPGSTFAGANVTFTWTAGFGVTNYQLLLGTNGPGTKSLFDSGVTTATSAAVTGLPPYGVTVYARLWSEIGGVWGYNDYTYMEAGIPAVLVSPTPGTTLPGSSVTFKWGGGFGISQYQLLLGTNGPGTKSLYDSGPVSGTSVTVTTLPMYGVKVYARLFSEIGGTWQYHDYTYTEAGTPSLLTVPTPGTTLPGSTVTFKWEVGFGITQYRLLLGTNGPGTSSLYDSGPVTATSATVTNLPAFGVTVYARLISQIGGTWQFSDYTYTEAGTPAVLLSPTPGGMLGTSNVVFTWSKGMGITNYQLLLGANGIGSASLYNSGPIAVTSTTVPSLPAYGVTVYARLLSETGGTWQYKDYTYTEAGTPAVLASPSPGSTLGTSNVTFTWSKGMGITNYQLFLGTNGPGTSGLYNSGPVTATSVVVPMLPAYGVAVYARLFSESGGMWQYHDYTFTESGTPAVLVSPKPGSILGISNVTFAWSKGFANTNYRLQLGTSAAGSSNLYDSGSITAISATVTSLPASGATVYARLLSKSAGVWSYNDYIYTEK
jgi:hypothetical protein